MRVLWIILVMMIAQAGLTQKTSISDQWIKFDQSFLDLWLKSYDQKVLHEKDLQKCLYDWKKLKTYLNHQFVLDPHSIHSIKSFDQGFSRINSIAESNKDLTISYTQIDLLRCDLMELRSSFSLQYPTDQIWRMLDSYKTVQNVLHDPLMDLLEWTEFSILVDDLFNRWNELQRTKFNQLMSPAKLDDFEDLRMELSECMLAFENSFETANQGNMTIECDKIETALINILRILANRDQGVQ